MKEDKLALLVIEDNPGDARLVHEMLKEAANARYDLEWSDRLSSGLKYLAEQQPDLILLDLGLPDSQGLDTLARVQDLSPRIPIVVMTGLDDESVGRAAVSRGAQDYLVKGTFDGRMLWRVIRYALDRKKAEEERLELERKAQNVSRLASIGELAAGIAHDINNPLTPILGFTDMLLKRDIPEDIRADLQIIHDCARQAADTTKRLLLFARQSKPMRTQCNINEVVETVLQLRAYHLKTNSIKVITELDSELPQTMADAGQMQQVVLNLIMNAEYAMVHARGGGNLLIKTEKMGNIIRLSIKDDGPGISKENMGKLFHPFFTTKTEGEGTGLGLSVCHGIMAEHHGRIYAESEVGKGATFIVELPIVSQQKELEVKLLSRE